MSRHNIAVLTGAGVSAESGLGTYRDNGGLWDSYDPMVVASAEGWQNNPGLVLDFYNSQRKKIRGTQPNQAHRAIAQMEASNNVTVITQNVDNLHERAGSTKVIHLHGEVTKVRPEFGEYDRTFSEKEVFDIGYDEVVIGDKAPNGRQLRPHIVFFGEAVPKLEKAIEAVEKADTVLIVGTSLQVYPAAGLYRYARPDARIFIIDPAPVNLHEPRIIHIKEKATAGMAIFLEKYLTPQTAL